MPNASLIEKQIVNCRNLLKVFREERESYTDNPTTDLKMVMRMLNRKQEILTSFLKQKELMSSIKEQGYQDEVQEKVLLRELGKILEQLLVIDQENEILLRDMVSKKPGATSNSSSATTLRPSRPFCPEVTPEEEIIVKTVVEEPQEEDPAMARINRFSRMKLKAYGA